MSIKLSGRAQMVMDICRALAAEPDDLSIHQEDSRDDELFFVESSSHNYGRLVGSKAATVKAILLLLRLSAWKDGMGARLEIEPEDDVHHPPDKKIYDPHWNETDLKEILEDICEQVFVFSSQVGVEKRGKSYLVAVDVSSEEGFDYLDGERKAYMISEVEQALSRIIDAVCGAKGQKLTKLEINKIL